MPEDKTDLIEETTTPEELPDPAMVGALRSLLDSDREAQRQEFATIIEAAKRPERRVVAVNDDEATQKPTPIESRTQPTDPLYRKLHRDQPAMAPYRTPELDHWGQAWCRALASKDVAAQQVAAEKLNARVVTEYDEGLFGAGNAPLPGGLGGTLLPQNFVDIIDIAREDAAVLASKVMNVTMTNGTVRVPTATAFVTQMVTEESTSDGAGPVLDQVMLQARKMQGLAVISDENLADSAFNFVNLLSRRAGSSMGELEDLQICTSSGTAPDISGPILGTPVTIIDGTGNLLQYGDIVNLAFGINKTYRTNAIWMGDSQMLGWLSTIEDAQGRPILNMPMQQNAPLGDTPGFIGTLFGKPVYEVPQPTGQLMFGDPRAYAFARQAGMTAKASEDARFETDQWVFKFTQRIDGDTVDVVGLAQIVGILGVNP